MPRKISWIGWMMDVCTTAAGVGPSVADWSILRHSISHLCRRVWLVCDRWTVDI